MLIKIKQGMNRIDMKRLIELAQSIKDKELREKVVLLLKDPKLSHKDFKKYPRMEWDKAATSFAASPMGAPVERHVLEHTITLAELCMKTAEIIEKNYNIPFNRDNLLAAALVHDVMHLYEFKRTKGKLEHTGIMLDHSMLGVAELYVRGFPEQVIHIVASHFGENGPTPPRCFEALIFHHLDTLIAVTEYHMYATKEDSEPMQLVLFDEETLKQITQKAIYGEKSETKKSDVK
jgi:7,8-dihydroneopterin 2',3'-cyclic phosphate phosphodiesterase